MPALVLVDTNVVVAGLLTSRDDSSVARVLDGMLAADFPFALSEALLAEYGSVLRRASLRAAHGLNLAELDIVKGGSVVRKRRSHEFLKRQRYLINPNLNDAAC